jgi:hypothetical protein
MKKGRSENDTKTYERGKSKKGIKIKRGIKEKNGRAKLRKGKAEEDTGREQIRNGQAINTLLLSVALNAKLTLLCKYEEDKLFVG